MTTTLLWIFGIFYVATCIWLILVVLLQEGKSGGMGGAESAGQAPGALTETFGASGASRGLFKVTSWTAGIFFVLALVLTLLGSRKEQMGGAIILEETSVPVQTQGATSAQPAPTTSTPAEGASE